MWEKGVSRKGTNGLALNTDKCELMTFLRRKVGIVGGYKIGDGVIEKVSSITDLGNQDLETCYSSSSSSTAHLRDNCPTLKQSLEKPDTTIAEDAACLLPCYQVKVTSEFEAYWVIIDTSPMSLLDIQYQYISPQLQYRVV
ncbi:hypothetical protein O3M35_006237 [Rhynocoris fuscipes]|uniref:Uncharacterized protein n=1 Tax=Rhynocoris fuscipes TaxID=488301 RepID=A0AAW1DD88_9HEMI